MRASLSSETSPNPSRNGGAATPGAMSGPGLQGREALAVLDIGGSQFQVAACDLDGNLHSPKKLAVPPTLPVPERVELMVAELEAMSRSPALRNVRVAGWVRSSLRPRTLVKK